MSYNEYNRININMAISKHIAVANALDEDEFSHNIPVTLPIGKKDGVDQLLLLEDFAFRSKRTGKTYIAKAGFVFDGASIPKWAWSIIGSPFSSAYIRSALIHDILYVTEAVERKLADQIFKDMLYADRASRWKVPLMYRAVRVGGGFVWDKHTNESKYKARKFIEIRG